MYVALLVAYIAVHFQHSSGFSYQLPISKHSYQVVLSSVYGQNNTQCHQCTIVTYDKFTSETKSV